MMDSKMNEAGAKRGKTLKEKASTTREPLPAFESNSPSPSRETSPGVVAEAPTEESELNAQVERASIVCE